MPTITGANVTEWKMKEMARRAGKKYEPEQPANPFKGLGKAEIKEQSKLLKEAKKESKKASKAE
jgi:hypothetical protein